MKIQGNIIEAFSEPINGAPVGVVIEDAEGKRHTIFFERRNWNDFVRGHSEDGTLPSPFPVVVEGLDEWNCYIRCEAE